LFFVLWVLKPDVVLKSRPLIAQRCQK
jgi:hypothetical protein